MESYATTWCERCGQQAAVAELTTPDGETARLCAHCAKSWEGAVGAWAAGAAGLAAGLAHVEGAAALLCPRCGFDVEDLVRRGRVGCPECYGAFTTQVVELLQQSMSNPQHGGKRPPARPRSTERETRER